MRSGRVLLVTWLVALGLWIPPILFLRRNPAFFFPLWPALLYFAVTVAFLLAAVFQSVLWLRRRRA